MNECWLVMDAKLFSRVVCLFCMILQGTKDSKMVRNHGFERPRPLGKWPRKMRANVQQTLFTFELGLVITPLFSFPSDSGPNVLNPCLSMYSCPFCLTCLSIIFCDFQTRRSVLFCGQGLSDYWRSIKPPPRLN